MGLSIDRLISDRPVSAVLPLNELRKRPLRLVIDRVAEVSAVVALIALDICSETRRRLSDVGAVSSFFVPKELHVFFLSDTADSSVLVKVDVIVYFAPFPISTIIHFIVTVRWRCSW
jgi:hypothetical protein